MPKIGATMMMALPEPSAGVAISAGMAPPSAVVMVIVSVMAVSSFSCGPLGYFTL